MKLLQGEQQAFNVLHFLKVVKRTDKKTAQNKIPSRPTQSGNSQQKGGFWLLSIVHETQI